MMAEASPITAGMSNSRAIVAACERRPPVVVTSAPACTRIEFHDGLVNRVITTSPGSIVAMALAGSSTTRARPV